MTEVGIGLGSNLGDRCENIIAALTALQSRSSIVLTRVSSVYETPPWGVTAQPSFLNAVALVETTLLPDVLLDICKKIALECTSTALRTPCKHAQFGETS